MTRAVVFERRPERDAGEPTDRSRGALAPSPIRGWRQWLHWSTWMARRLARVTDTELAAALPTTGVPARVYAARAAARRAARDLRSPRSVADPEAAHVP